jgi:hypothetical protein
MPRTPRMLVQFAAVLAATAALTGCGAGSEPAPRLSAPAAPAAEGVSREAYITVADALCAHVHATSPDMTRRIRRTAERAGSADAALTAIAPLLAAARDQWSRHVQEFKAIAPPAADRAAIGMLWANYDASAAMLGRVADAARDRDLDRFNSLLATHQALTVRGFRLAQRYGFHECGRTGRAAASAA